MARYLKSRGIVLDALSFCSLSAPVFYVSFCAWWLSCKLQDSGARSPGFSAYLGFEKDALNWEAALPRHD